MPIHIIRDFSALFVIVCERLVDVCDYRFETHSSFLVVKFYEKNPTISPNIFFYFWKQCNKLRQRDGLLNGHFLMHYQALMKYLQTGKA